MRQYLLPREFEYPFSGSSNHPSGVDIRIEGKDYHYLIHVLRYEEGAEIRGVDHSGNQYELTIREIGPDSLSLRVFPLDSIPFIAQEHAPYTEIFLFQAILKGKKMDRVIRQATETGVSRIIPLITEHTIVHLDSAGRKDKKTERWNTIIGEAMQQSGSQLHPLLYTPLRIQEIDRFWRQLTTNSAIPLFFHQDPLENGSLHRYLSNWPRQVALVIGPEGGLSAGETDYLRGSGFLPVHLKTNILRAETAAVYAIGAVQSILQEREQWQITSQTQRQADIAE